MAFGKQPEYRDFADKLDQEKVMHRGRDFRAFDELVILHNANKGRLPLTVIAYLFDVRSVNTIKSWIQQRNEYYRKVAEDERS